MTGGLGTQLPGVCSWKDQKPAGHVPISSQLGSTFVPHSQVTPTLPCAQGEPCTGWLAGHHDPPLLPPELEPLELLVPPLLPPLVLPPLLPPLPPPLLLPELEPVPPSVPASDELKVAPPHPRAPRRRTACSFDSLMALCA
jgi:hypothetical protein